MAVNKPVWGIDLGQCALKAIRLRAAGDKVEALDHVHIEHGRILSQPDVDRPALIAESMNKFLDKHDLSNEIIVVGVPGQHTLARFTKLPPVDKKKVPEIVKYEAQQQIPFDMDEVIWDYQHFDDPEGVETEVGIFAMRRELMREHLRYLSDRNLEPALVQASPLALYNALFYDGLCGAEPVAILDIGAQNTDLLVVDGNSLWTRNIPIGGNHFTETLVKTFKLSFNKAENLKRSAGSSKYARQVFQAMRPVFADLVAEVQRSIGFFTSSRRGVKLSKLLAMGNAFKLPGMPKFIQQNLGLEVVRPTTFNRLSTSSAPDAPKLIDHLLSFGVAYGLALQGLGLSQITSNLLPPEIAKQVIYRRKTPWFYGAAACLALAAVLIWGRNFSDQRALAAASGAGETPPPPPRDVQAATRIIENGPSDPNMPPKFYVQQIVDAGKVLVTEVEKVESENAQQLTKAKEIEDLQAHKVIWPEILNMIHSALPPLEPDLARALTEGPKAYKALIESDEQYARRNRKQIWIKKLKADYSPDVMASYEAIISGSSSRTPDRLRTMAPAQPASAPLRGFVISLTGQTPFAGGADGGRGRATDFLTRTLVANLKKNGRAETELYFDKVRLTWCNEVGQSGSPGTWKSSTLHTPSPVRRYRTGAEFGSERGVATIARTTEGNDPVTGETTLKDWEFEIVFVAVLGKRPQTDPSAG